MSASSLKVRDVSLLSPWCLTHTHWQTLQIGSVDKRSPEFYPQNPHENQLQVFWPDSQPTNVWRIWFFLIFRNLKNSEKYIWRDVLFISPLYCILSKLSNKRITYLVPESTHQASYLTKRYVCKTADMALYLRAHTSSFRS